MQTLMHFVYVSLTSAREHVFFCCLALPPAHSCSPHSPKGSEAAATTTAPKGTNKHPALPTGGGGRSEQWGRSGKALLQYSYFLCN